MMFDLTSRVTISVTEDKQVIDNHLENIFELENVASNQKSFSDQRLTFQELTLVSFEAIRQYIAFLWKRYQEKKSREEKAEILDELCRNLNIHRKSAVRLMTKKGSPPQKRRGASKQERKKYSSLCREQVSRYWKKTGYISSPRLKSAIADWLQFDDNLKGNDSVCAELLRVSASTIERWLKAEKAALRRRLNSGTRSARKIVSKVPIRNLDHQPQGPGDCELDTVHHCGGSLSGKYTRSLTCVDLDTAWTECEAIEELNGASIKSALEKIEERLPFIMTGFYADGGLEFWNKDVLDRFINRLGREIPLQYGRGRPYKKNDQAHVEQKNYTHVRQYFGYDRLSGKVVTNKMNTIYRSEWRLLQNFFLPNSKLIVKQRIGSSIIRKFDEPKTPFERMLQSPKVDNETKARLLKQRESLNPFELREKLTKKLRELRRWLKEDWTTPFYGKYHDKV